MKNLKTFEQLNIESDKLDEMYFGKGYESDYVKMLQDEFPDLNIKYDGKLIVILKDNQILFDLEMGPISGYRYAKLSMYDKNGEFIGASPVEKVEDAIDEIKINL